MQNGFLRLAQTFISEFVENHSPTAAGFEVGGWTLETGQNDRPQPVLQLTKKRETHSQVAPLLSKVNRLEHEGV